MHRAGIYYFRRFVALIDAAVQEIHIQTYIWEDDETGRMVHEAVMAAAQRGVQVNIILDAYGSIQLMRRSSIPAAWTAAGIRYHWFGRPFSGENFNLSRRLHHKLLVVDGWQAMVGGMNIADRYNDLPGIPAWLDFAWQVTGPSSMQLREIALTLWRGRIPEPQPIQLPTSREPEGDVPVRIIQNDWLRGVYAINEEHRIAFSNAQTSVLIVGAYFTPGLRIRKSLKTALTNGARVRILLSRHSDVWLARYATRYLYGWMFHNGIEVYEWTTTVTHGKMAIVDDNWCTIGSYNLNFLSAYESIELNYVTQHAPTVRRITQDIEQILQQECEVVRAEDYDKHLRWWEPIMEWIAYRMFRITTRLFTLFGQRKAREKQ